MKKKTLLARCKEAHQDFEWYPTTQEIIDLIKTDLSKSFDFYEPPSIMDLGAGDGRVLNALTTGKRYAVEKSKPLLNALALDIFVVGTDFHQQTLIDKKVDVIFSNPPYSEFEAWAVKIIKEANAKVCYLVIPQRWENDSSIRAAIKTRNAEVRKLGCFDFLSGERQARAKVHVLKITLTYTHGQVIVDPFHIWFEEHFQFSNKNPIDLEDTRKEKVKNALVSGKDLVQTLENLYHTELTNLVATYKKLTSLDMDLLEELGVEPKSVLGALKLKITGLKNLFWQALFDQLTEITDKLTHKSRKTLLKTLVENTNVDFSCQNAYAVLIWCIKNANSYFDQQLIETAELLVTSANIKLYKSNKRTYGENDWCYSTSPRNLSHYALDHRLVLHRVGGLIESWASGIWKLSDRARDFIQDLLTIANNLGYWVADSEIGVDWVSGQKKDFYCTHTRSDKAELLMQVKAFKNGNLHLKCNPKFIRKLNVEFGRLKGWLQNSQTAHLELGIPLKEAQTCFEENLKLEVDNWLRLTEIKT